MGKSFFDERETQYYEKIQKKIIEDNAVKVRSQQQSTENIKLEDNNYDPNYSYGNSTKPRNYFDYLTLDTFWTDKYKYDDAEAEFFRQRKKATKKTQDIKDHTNHKSDDEDQTDNDKKGSKAKKESKNRENTEKSENQSFDINNQSSNWTDESTYLKPNIPVIQPKPFSFSTKASNVVQEMEISKQAECLSNYIENISKEEVNYKKMDIEFDSKDLKVIVHEIGQELQESELQFHQSDVGDLDSQYTLVKHTLENVEDLETTAKKVEKRLQQEETTVDIGSLNAELTGLQTKLVVLHTEMTRKKMNIEKMIEHRAKKLKEM